MRIQISKKTKMKIICQTKHHEVENNMPEIESLDDGHTYTSSFRCHGFMTGNRKLSYPQANEVAKELMNEGKVFSNPKLAQKGDLVFYYEEGVDEFIHYGLVTKRGSISKMMIVSKWGCGDVFQHNPLDAPYHTADKILFCKSANKVNFQKIVNPFMGDRTSQNDLTRANRIIRRLLKC